MRHPAQGKTGASRLKHAAETGTDTAGDDPESCHRSGPHSGVVLPPLKGSFQAHEVLLHPGVPCPEAAVCTGPKAWPSEPSAQPFSSGTRQCTHSTGCEGPSTLPPRNDDMASEADSLAVIGRKWAAARLAD